MKFGTVARYRVKPGHADKLRDEMGSFNENPPAGWLYHTVFRSTTNPDEVWMSVVFDSEESYRANANSPDMNRDYEKMMAHLDGEPEWHDGHVIDEQMRESPQK